MLKCLHVQHECIFNERERQRGMENFTKFKIEKALSCTVKDPLKKSLDVQFDLDL